MSEKLEKIFLIVLCVLAIILFLLLGFLFIYVYSSYYSNNIKIVENSETMVLEDYRDIELEQSDNIENIEYNQEDILKVEKKKDEIINIVLSGVDTRGHNMKSLSDSIILVSYNKTQHNVKLVSFMRDSWVYLPNRGWGRINSATVYGGMGLLINTLNENFDLDIQHYAQINFIAFKQVIDIIGGIDIELTQAEINYINEKLHSDDGDYKNDIKDKAGLVHLNGTQTLWHCRNRTIGNSDFSRTERQRDVLTILMNQVTTLSKSEILSLIYDLKDYVEMNIPITILIDIGVDILKNRELTIESYRVPFDDMYRFASKNGASVIELDLEKITEKLHSILDLVDD